MRPHSHSARFPADETAVHLISEPTAMGEGAPLEPGTRHACAVLHLRPGKETQRRHRREAASGIGRNGVLAYAREADLGSSEPVGLPTYFCWKGPACANPMRARAKPLLPR